MKEILVEIQDTIRTLSELFSLKNCEHKKYFKMVIEMEDAMFEELEDIVKGEFQVGQRAMPRNHPNQR